MPDDLAATFRQNHKQVLSQALETLRHLEQQVEKLDLEEFDPGEDWWPVPEERLTGEQAYKLLQSDTERIAAYTEYESNGDWAFICVPEGSFMVEALGVMINITAALKKEAWIPRYRCELDDRLAVLRELRNVVDLLEASCRVEGLILADDQDPSKCWEFLAGEWRRRDRRPGEKTAASIDR